MAKLSRESKLRERRAHKQAKKAMRKQMGPDHSAFDDAATAEAGQSDAEQTVPDVDAAPPAHLQ